MEDQEFLAWLFALLGKAENGRIKGMEAARVSSGLPTALLRKSYRMVVGSKFVALYYTK